MTQATMSRQEQAELFVIEMDAVEAEIQQTSDWQLGASCQAELESIKAEIVALGYEVKLVPTGWALLEPVVEEVAQAASQEKKTMEVPSADLFARQAKSGLTRQSYTQVVQVIDRINEAEARFRALMEEAASITTSYDQFPGDIASAPEPVRKLYKLCEKRTPIFQYGKTRREMYLVETWEKGLLHWERQMAEISQAIAACQQEREVAQAASQEKVELKEDEMGLYAEVPASTGKGAYTVRVCAKWLYSVSCDCAARGDCRHRVQIDRTFDAVRPTFSEQCAGMVASREVIARLVGAPDRYREPLKGSGVTGFRAASIERKLAA